MIYRYDTEVNVRYFLRKKKNIKDTFKYKLRAF
jgi:hypothetical protein